MYTRGRAGVRARGRARGGAQAAPQTRKVTVNPSEADPTATSSRPQRSNANHNPAKVVLDAKQPRRSSKEVQTAKEKAAATRLAAVQEKETREASTVQHLALIEDQARQEDTYYDKNALRPDLRVLKRAKIVYS